MATQTLYYGGTGTDPLIRITISDASGGAFTVKVEQVQATDGDASRDPDGKFYLGDLRGFFIDFASPIKAATVSGYSAHSGYDVPATVAQTTSLVAGKTVAYGTNVTSVGGSDNNMSGATKTGYDIGMEIGSAGIGKDDIGAISFTLNKTGLTLDELVKSTTFGVRITSVAQDVNKDGDVTDAGESRSLSSKIASPAPPPPNSNPVAVVDAGSVKEDQGPIAGNVLENDTDANTDTLSVSGVTHAGAVDNGTTITVKGAYGTLVITKATGAYTYTLDNSSATVQGLREGDVKKEVFSYSISDGRGGSGGSTLTIDVIGVNDAAVLTSATKELTEGNTAAALSTSGTLPISDVDSAETFQAQTDTAGTYGKFSIGTDGAWTYTATSAHDALKEGEKVSDTFTVKSADGTETSVTINITGTNDAAVLTSATKELTEGNTAAALSTSGTLPISDVDSAETFQAQTDTAGTYGKFSIGTDGAWTYTATSAHDALKEGEKVSDTFTVKSADGTETSVTINITGTNDAAVLTSATKELTEGNTAAALSTSGTLPISDVDSAETFQAQTDTAGTYGKFSIGTDGAWTYTATSAHDALKEGEKVSDTFTVKSADGTETSVTINITGTNDAAVLTSATKELTEGNTAAALSTSGTLPISDVDSAETFQAQTDTAGTYGKFSIGTDGAWTYTATSAHDALKEGEKVSDTFTVKSADGTETSVTINITGTNDAAVLTSATKELTEGNTAAALSTSGTLPISDVDSAETFQAQTDTAGTYGKFSIGTDGAWTYTATSAHDALKEGEKVSDTFTVKSADGTETSVTINITGTNDAAVLTSATKELTEGNTAAALSTSGTLPISDVDSAETFQAQTDTAGTYGKFSIGTDGAWTYTATSAHDALKEGEKVSDTFTVKSADGTETSVTINITGTNDAAVLTSATKELTEGNTAAALSTSGTLPISDVDSAETFQAQTDTAGTYGKFSIGTDGAWTYTATSAHDALKEGEKVSDTFTVKSADGTETSVTINITGTNDAAVLTSATKELTEGNTAAALSTSGTLPISDVDSAETFQAQTDTAGTYGKFSIGTDGAWTYTATSAHDALKEGEKVSDTFTVKSADGTETSVTINITGTNDAAVLTSATKELTEGNTAAALSTSGTLPISDVDSAETFQAQTDTAGTYGKFSIGTDGAWTYTATSAHDALKEGEKVSDTFTVKSADGTETSVTINITGTNDAAVLTSATKELTEGNTAAALSTSGTLPISDVDSAETFQAQTDTAGTYGKFSIGTDGAWTYTATSAHDALKEGEKVSDTFTVKSADGTETSVTINITGTNDAAVLTSATKELTEGNTAAALSTSGTLPISDVDSAETFQAQTDTAGTYGKFSIGTDGAWTYTATSAHDALKEGEKVSDTFTVKSADGTETSVTINITGTNDAAVLTSATKELTEGNTAAALSTSGTLPISDVDSAETFQAQTDTAGTYGKFSIGTDGAWTYTATSAHDALKEGEKVSDTFTVKSADGTETSVTINITGTNDAAVLTSATKELTEGNTAAALSTSGTLPISDVDSAETFQAQTDTAGTYGKFSIGTDGAWTYTATSAHDALKEGEKVSDTFTVKSADGTETSVTINITGTNDAAVLTSATKELTEGNTAAALSTSGTLPISDVDSAETFQAQTDTAGTYGKFSIGTDGAWTYTATSAHDALKEGEKVSDTFTVKSADGTETSVTINITGTNDAAVLTSATKELTEGNTAAALSTSGTLPISDVDSAETFQAQTDTAGTYGKFSIGTDGAWTYTATSAHDALKEGEKVSDTFTVKSADGTETSVTINITGTNDAAVLTSATKELTEGNTAAALSTSGTLPISDVDSAETFQAQTDTAGTYGKFSIGTDGAWTYTATSAHDALKEGEKVSDTFTVKSADGTETSVTINITGTNDAAVLTSATKELTEGNTAAALSTSGTLPISDVDSAETFQAQTDTAGTYGKFSIGTDGAWTYTATSAHDALKEGEKVSDTFTVKSADGTETSVTINITGTNDAAVLTSATKELTEGNTAAALSTSGTLPISDVDSAETFQAQTDTAGTYGKFSIGTDGAWTYTATSAHDALKEGEKVSDTFTVKSADGTETSVTINITGTNDAAVLTSATKELTEGNTAAALSTSGTLPISDVDSAETFQAQTDTAGTYGKFSIGTDGAWTYTATSAHDALKEGEKVSDTFTVKSADGTETSVTINITGTNDAAVLTSATKELTEGNTAAALSTSGTLPISDVDSAETFQAQTDTAGTYGKFSIGTDGAWTYTATSAHDALKEGEKVSDTFTVKSADGTETSVTINITGTNDAAVLTSATKELTEGNTAAALSTSGTLPISDVDSAETFQAQTDTAGTYGKFSIGTDGAWTYTATSAHDALKEGEKVSDTFTVKSADGTETSVTINITGTNDAPKLTGQQTQLPSGEEDGTYTFATADLLKGFTDVDGGPLSVVDVTASNGTLVNNGGTWTYTPNLNYNGPVTLNYTVIDGKGGSAPGSLEFSLAPVNDAPVNTVASAQTIGSGQTLVFSGANKISIADVDVGSAPLTVTLTGQNGTITLGGSTSGMTVSGDGTGTVTLTGTLSQINGALDNLQFKAATNFGGAGGITINTNDNGNIGSGGALTDTDTIAITINQAGPGAGGGPAPTPISFLVEEDDLSGGVNDNGSSTLVKTGTVASLFSGSGYTYSLVAPSLPAMTSKGQALTYAVAGTTLFAFIESNSTAGYQSGVERAVFSFDLKPNGDYTFTLLDALDHTGSPGTNILLNLGGAIKATDQFGNSATAASTAFKVDVVDDVPVAVESQEGLVINKGGQSGTFNLDTDANIDNNFGIDGAQVSFPTSLSGDSGLTSGGAAISYRVSSDGRTLTAFTGSGVTESTVFTVVLNPDGSTVANDKYTVTMLRAVDAPVTSNDFASGVYQFSGGNNPWAGFRTDANDNSQDLLLTPMAGGVSGSTMNTTNTAGGVGSGASVNTGEAVRLDFVTDLSGNNSGTNAGYGDAINQDHSFDGHYLTNGASTFISGLAQKTANILVKAFDDPDGAAGSTALKTVGDGTKDVINSVAITYNGTTKVASGSNTVVTLTFGLEPSAVSVKVNFTATGEALVEGIRNDTRIAVFTADKYNSLEFHHAGGDTFVIGGFGSTVSTAGSTVDFALPVQLRDGDGDIATGQLTLNLRPDGITPTVGNDTAETLSVSSGNDIIYARGGNDTVNASDGSDALSGGSGNDTLSGGNGNDRLTGGSGKDLMTGGADGDTFIFLAVNDSPAAVATRDVITDFTPSSDLINLAGIDANSLVNGNQAFTFGGETSSVLANQVTWYFDTASNTAIVQADVNGDTTADLQIQLNGWDATKKLLVSDFVL